MKKSGGRLSFLRSAKFWQRLLTWSLFALMGGCVLQHEGPPVSQDAKILVGLIIGALSFTLADGFVKAIFLGLGLIDDY